MSYYHIAEHFFEQIYSEDVVRQVRKKIQAPGFSSNRERDISQLVKLVSKLTREQREDAAPMNEQRALELVLTKYVNISDLMDAVGSLDRNSIHHYKNNKVDFSDGDVVPFDGTEESRVVTLLARRIYKTRNAIVHSKNNELPRYRPFYHAKSLHKEIPLLRSIAEAILVGSAQPIT
ncbi:hypothetical protein [Frankia sp. EI5c]|uniref:hypothetical protein n=1 Tax=Frankia sp. EI5c TaxID=683316 RepID=UPI000FF8ABB3|nr:hypothetical protein [Frankia sp. EI5c]